jgi:hypothetical protein
MATLVIQEPYFSPYDFSSEESSEDEIEEEKLVFIDWDDTLYPTSFVRENREDIVNNKDKWIPKFDKLDKILFRLFSKLDKICKFRIVTNASYSWFEMSLDSFPLCQEMFIAGPWEDRVYSAKDEAGYLDPDNPELWKKVTFQKCALNILKSMNMIQHIVSIGDSSAEHKALMTLHRKNFPYHKPLDKRFLKSIIYKSNPTLGEVIYQNKVLHQKIEYILNLESHKKFSLI